MDGLRECAMNTSLKVHDHEVKMRPVSTVELFTRHIQLFWSRPAMGFCQGVVLLSNWDKVRRARNFRGYEVSNYYRIIA